LDNGNQNKAQTNCKITAYLSERKDQNTFIAILNYRILNILH